jgi:hypothetical protein
MTDCSSSTVFLLIAKTLDITFAHATALPVLFNNCSTSTGKSMASAIASVLMNLLVFLLRHFTNIVDVQGQPREKKRYPQHY